MAKITKDMVNQAMGIHSFHRIVAQLLSMDLGNSIVTDALSDKQIRDHAAIGDCLRIQRQALGWSKKKLAKKFGVPKDFITLIELGYVSKFQILIDSDTEVSPLVSTLQRFFIASGVAAA